eukprot:6178984-Pleurochrysis_carterae.AAC.1
MLAGARRAMLDVVPPPTPKLIDLGMHTDTTEKPLNVLIFFTKYELRITQAPLGDAREIRLQLTTAVTFLSLQQ